MRHPIAAISVAAWLAIFAAPASAQTQANTHISTGGTLPATCRVGDLFYKTGGSDGLYTCSATNTWSAGSASATATAIGITIDGGGAAIVTGVKGFITSPAAGTITRATILSTDAAATAGSIVVEVWKDVYGSYPPTGADKICASACPTLSTASKADDSTLTGWGTTIAAGDVLGFSVTSVTGVTRVTLILTVAH